MRFFQGFLLSCCVLTLVACGDDDPEPDSDHRTVLVYIGGENSLEGYVSLDLDEMKQVAGDIPASDNLLVYVDDLSTPRIYKIGMENGKGTSSVVKAYSADLCSSDPAVLRDVCRWTVENYPAESYGLVLWSHGNGWLPAGEIRDTRSFIVDNGNNASSDSGPEMEITSLKEVLVEVFGNKGLDFLLFDACFMQSVEVAYELRNTTRWLIATPAEMPGTGSPYDRLIACIFASAVDVEGIVNAYYNEYIISYYGIVISAVRTSELEAFAQVSAPLVRRYLSDDAVTEGVFAYLPRALDGYPFYHDIKGLMLKNVPETELQEWKEQLQKTVPYMRATDTWYSDFGGSVGRGGQCTVDHEQCSGLSMYVTSQKSGSAENKKSWDEYLKTLEWYRDIQ